MATNNHQGGRRKRRRLKKITQDVKEQVCKSVSILQIPSIFCRTKLNMKC